MRIYYTTDLHGSEKCWRKFLVTPKYYNADVLIVGGDITGKFIVPIVKLPKGRYEATFMGRKRKMKKEKDVEKLKQLIAFSGQYAVEVTPEEYAEYQENPSLLDSLFDRMLVERVEQWMVMADEKLRGTGIKCFVTAGNDDAFNIDEAIAKSEILS